MKALRPVHESIAITALKEALRREKDARVARRIQAILWRIEGKSVHEVTELLDIARSSLCRWVKAFNQDGLNGLKDHPGGGRADRLTQEQKESLKALLEGEPPEGYGSQWRGKNLQQYLLDKLFVSYGKSEIYRLLAELGYSLQRPKRRYLDADPHKVAQHKEELAGEKRKA
jgi:transposase